MLILHLNVKYAADLSSLVRLFIWSRTTLAVCYLLILSKFSKFADGLSLCFSRFYCCPSGVLRRL